MEDKKLIPTAKPPVGGRGAVPKSGAKVRRDRKRAEAKRDVEGEKWQLKMKAELYQELGGGCEDLYREYGLTPWTEPHVFEVSQKAASMAAFTSQAISSDAPENALFRVAVGLMEDEVAKASTKVEKSVPSKDSLSHSTASSHLPAPLVDLLGCTGAFTHAGCVYCPTMMQRVPTRRALHPSSVGLDSMRQCLEIVLSDAQPVTDLFLISNPFPFLNWSKPLDLGEIDKIIPANYTSADLLKDLSSVQRWSEQTSRKHPTKFRSFRGVTGFGLPCQLVTSNRTRCFLPWTVGHNGVRGGVRMSAGVLWSAIKPSQTDWVLGSVLGCRDHEPWESRAETWARTAFDSSPWKLNIDASIYLKKYDWVKSRITIE